MYRWARWEFLIAITPLRYMPLPPRFLRALLVRGVLLWLLARLMVIATLAWAQAVSKSASATVSPDANSALVPVWTVVALSILLLVDLHRRKELSLLHNLGVATSQAVFIGTLPAVILEAAVRMIRR